MSLDCTIIYPYLEEANWKNELRSKDNLALGYLTSCLRQNGFKVSMIHAEHHKYSSNQIIKILKDDPPKCVGISCTAQRAYPIVREYANKIKELIDIPIFIGGIFPTIAYEKILIDCPSIDVISLGEGEYSTVEYLKHIVFDLPIENIKGIAYRNNNGSIITNMPINVIENLDTLPFPAKDYFEDMKEELKTGFYYINISAGRGCYGNCSFCSTGKLTGTSKRRVRSVSNVLDEIVYFQNKYNVSYFKFVDELFIDKTNLEWIFDFCNEIKLRKIKIKFHAEARVDCISESVIAALKEVGLDELFIGLESGNQKILNQYRKGHKVEDAKRAVEIVRKYNINLQFGYIMIDPTLSFEELHENIEWLLKIGGYSKHNLYNKLNLYYGTDLYKTLQYLQIDDDKPFYERKISFFVDSRVETFAKYIDLAKSQFSDYNKMVNEYLLDNIKKGVSKHIWSSIAQRIDENETRIWTELIMKAFDKAESNCVDTIFWNDFVDEKIQILREFFLLITKK